MNITIKLTIAEWRDLMGLVIIANNNNPDDSLKKLRNILNDAYSEAARDYELRTGRSPR